MWVCLGRAWAAAELDDEGCYFHKQPETPSETNDAIRAILVSCVAAYRYGGTDLGVRRRLAEAGCSAQVDHPLEGHRAIVRNHVRFTLLAPEAATDVARLLVAAFPCAEGGLHESGVR